MSSVVLMAAPRSTAAAKSGKSGGSAFTEAMLPRSPSTELQRMNTAATPDAVRVSDQVRKSRSGDRKMLPPVPVSPESQPIAAPASTAIHSGGSDHSRLLRDGE